MVDYKTIANEARIKVLKLIYKAQTSHIGSNFSCIDILATLFERINLAQDKFVLSAGWKAASLYYFLHRKGVITQEDLDSYCQPGSNYIGLAEPTVPGVTFAGGSMGFGLPASVGFALAKKLSGDPGRVYCLMSDGEQAIGTTWESAMIAAHHKLDNLCVIVDKNGLQAMGASKDVLDYEPLHDKWAAFGWEVRDFSGHSYQIMEQSFKILPEPGKPLVLIMRTTKGKGVSFMENNNLYHYKAPNKEEYEAALKELRQ